MGDFPTPIRDAIRDSLADAMPPSGPDDRITDYFAREVSLVSATANGFTFSLMEPQEPGSWPLHTDLFHMGAYSGLTELLLLHAGGREEFNNCYVILAHVPSGRRLKVTLPDGHLSAREGNEGQLQDGDTGAVGIGGFLVGSTVFTSSEPFVESIWPASVTLDRLVCGEGGKCIWDEDPEGGSRQRTEPWLRAHTNPDDPSTVLLRDVRCGGSGRGLMVFLPSAT